MPKVFMPDLPREQRIRLMQDNCEKIEKTTFLKDLTQEELDVNRELLSENLIQLSDWEDELTDIKESYKTKMKPRKEHNKRLLQEVKTRRKEFEGQLFHMPDYDLSIMEIFDETGEFISSRRLRPEEKQGRIFPVPKAVND